REEKSSRSRQPPTDLSDLAAAGGLAAPQQPAAGFLRRAIAHVTDFRQWPASVGVRNPLAGVTSASAAFRMACLCECTPSLPNTRWRWLRAVAGCMPRDDAT